MTNFYFTELVPESGDTITTGLGIATGTTTGQYSSNDVGRAVKLGNLSNHVEVASGDEIDGFITSVEPATVNGGMNLGSIRQEGRKVVTAGGPIALGSMVVAGVQPPIATVQSIATLANLNNSDTSQAVVISGTPVRALWRAISNVSSPGAAIVAGQKLVIERV